MGVIFDHGVEDDQQFSHACGDDDFELFAFGFEAFGELSDDWVAPSGGESRHVEDASHGGPSPPYRSFAAEASAIAVEGGQADQGGDFLPVEDPQLGKLGQQRGDGHRADARDTAEQVHFILPVIVGFKQVEDMFLDAFDLLVQQVDDLLDAFADCFKGDRFQAVFFGGSQFDELTSTDDELIEFGLFFRCFFEGSRPDVLAEAGDDGSVEAIRLGKDAESSGEVTDLTRVDDGDVMADAYEFGDQSPLIPAGGFDHEQTCTLLRQLPEQLPQTFFVIGERELFLLGKKADVEGKLGNVDADKVFDRIVHGFVPSLRMRTRGGTEPIAVLAAVRAYSKRPATIPLRDGLGGPRHARSVTGYRGEACSATLRRLPHDSFHQTLCL